MDTETAPRTATGGAAWQDPADGRAFRDVLGAYPTGVVIVTASDGEARHGLAVNSFTSVSLDPPIVSFCAGHSSTTWPDIRAAGSFAVSILGAQHEHVCRVFSATDVDRFEDPALTDAWASTPSGLPVLTDALGSLDCEIEAVHACGDHDIVLGRVTSMSLAGASHELAPLLYHRGGFARLATT